MSDTAAVETDEQGQETETEIEARKRGWVPKEEYRGAEDDWKPAKEWLDHGETEKQRLKKENAELQERLSANEATLKETKDTLEQFKGFYNKAEKRAYDKALKDLKAKQREAVKDGDEEAFAAAEKEIDALDKEVKEAAKPKTNGQEPPEHPDFKAWTADNPWYTGTDRVNLEMRKYCDDMAEYVADAHPSLKGRAFFDKMTGLVKEKFPDQFENPRRNSPGTVEGGGSNAPRPKNERSYENLPAEAKRECDRFVADKLLTREQYCADYEWE